MPARPCLSRALLFATLALAACAAGCSTADRGDGLLGQAVEASDGICNEGASASIDGIPAYQYCGNFNVYTDNGVDTASSNPGGWTQTEGGYGYQCVELAVRYFYFKWNVSHGWFVGYATDMCGTHPSDVSVTSSPVHGDLAVITPGCAGADPTAGHVFAIDSISGSTIASVQQNPAGTYNWPTSCVQCYLHAASNGGSQDPCATAQSGNGYYCGQSSQFGGGTQNVLYLCQNGVTQSTMACQYGCTPEPAGTNDQCAAGPGDPCATAMSGNGEYCGQSTQFGGGTPNVLYDCQNGKTASTTDCQYGCQLEPAGTNDQCAPMPSSTSSTSAATSTSAAGSTSAASSGNGAGGASGTGGTSGASTTSSTSGVSTTSGASTTSGGSGTGASHGAGGSEATGGATQQHSGCSVGGGGEPARGAGLLAAVVAMGLAGRRRRARDARVVV